MWPWWWWPSRGCGVDRLVVIRCSRSERILTLYLPICHVRYQWVPAPPSCPFASPEYIYIYVYAARRSLFLVSAGSVKKQPHHPIYIGPHIKREAKINWDSSFHVTITSRWCSVHRIIILGDQIMTVRSILI